MASGGAIRAGAAFVELLVKDGQLVKGLQNASKKLKAFGESVTGWGRKLAGIGAAVVAPLAGAGKAFAQMGDQIAKASARTGVTVESLSELAYAASLSGSDLETLEKGLRKMQGTLVGAAKGSEGAVEALGQLGLTVDDLRGLSPDEQFKRIADRLAQIKSPALKSAVAMAIFGRAGANLLPLMASGAKGIEELQQQARALGLTMRTEDAQAAEKLNDTMDALWKVLKHAAFTIGAALAPTLIDVAKWITDLVVRTTAWIRQNKELVVWVFKIAALVVGAGVALLALGYAVSAVGVAIGALATVVSMVGAAFGVLGSIIAWLVSPIGLVIVAVTALGGYLLYASGLGGKALAWLGERFTDLWGFASEAFGGIADALMAGDIALAAQILWLTLRIAWLKGVQVLESAWLSFRNFFIKIGYDAFYGVQAVWEIVQNALCVAWIEMTAFLSKVWTSFTGGFKKAWNGAINWTSKRMLELQGLFDKSLDVNAAKKMADDDLAATNKEIDRQTQAALAAREGQRKAHRKAAEEEHTHNMTRIGEESLAKEKALDAEYQQKMKAAQDELDASKKEWQDAIAKARQARKLKESQGPDRLEPPPSVSDYLEGLGPTIQQAQNKTVGVHGTFNAMEAPGMRAGGVADRLAKAAEETAKNTKKLVDLAKDDGQEFD